MACTWAKNKTILFYPCCGVPLQLYVDLVVGSDSQFGSKEQLCKKSSVLADWLSSGKVRSVYGSRVSELPTDRIESSSGAWLCYWVLCTAEELGSPLCVCGWCQVDMVQVGFPLIWSPIRQWHREFVCWCWCSRIALFRPLFWLCLHTHIHTYKHIYINVMYSGFMCVMYTFCYVVSSAVVLAYKHLLIYRWSLFYRSILGGCVCALAQELKVATCQSHNR